MGLHVSLPEELENLVHQEVKTGMYGSASELVREALRDFFDHMSGREIKNLSDFRNEMQTRYRQVLAGDIELIDGEEAFIALTEKHGLNT